VEGEWRHSHGAEAGYIGRRGVGGSFQRDRIDVDDCPQLPFTTIIVVVDEREASEALPGQVDLGAVEERAADDDGWDEDAGLNVVGDGLGELD
jgi:hypothetical protein